MFQDQRNGFAQVIQALLTRLALAVRTRKLGAAGYVPRAILLDDGSKLVAPGSILLWSGLTLRKRQLS